MSKIAIRVYEGVAYVKHPLYNSPTCNECSFWDERDCLILNNPDKPDEDPACVESNTSGSRRANCFYIWKPLNRRT